MTDADGNALQGAEVVSPDRNVKQAAGVKPSQSANNVQILAELETSKPKVNLEQDPRLLQKDTNDAIKYSARPVTENSDE